MAKTISVDVGESWCVRAASGARRVQVPQVQWGPYIPGRRDERADRRDEPAPGMVRCVAVRDMMG